MLDELFAWDRRPPEAKMERWIGSHPGVRCDIVVADGDGDAVGAVVGAAIWAS